LGCWWTTSDGSNISSAGLASMDVRSSWASSHKQATHQFGRKRIGQQGTRLAVDSKQEKGLLVHASHLRDKTSSMSRARWKKVGLACRSWAATGSSTHAPVVEQVAGILGFVVVVGQQECGALGGDDVAWVSMGPHGWRQVAAQGDVGMA
jgi:hypothetical protein